MAHPTFTQRSAKSLLLLGIMFFVIMVVFFFVNIATTTSPYTIGGVTAPYQFFYNFMNDRWFQTSLFANEATGVSVGFEHNPFPYLHIFAIHVYFTPFLFAPLWNLWPNVYWLYGLVIAINYAAMLLFAHKALRHLSPQSHGLKTVFTAGVLFLSGFLFTFQQNAQLMLFGGPLLLAAYYCLLVQKRNIFMLTLVLLCLVSEDLAMVAVTFSAYIVLFERKVRSYGVIGGGLALAYLALVLFFIQPAARYHLTLSELNTSAFVLKHILDFSSEMISSRLVGIAPAILFLPAFALIWLLFGKPKVSWSQLGGLILLAPAPHWGESIVVGASHHLMPVIMFMFVAFVVALGRTPDSAVDGRLLTRKSAFLSIAVCVVFFLGSFRVMISNLPGMVLLPIYHLAAMTEKAKRIENSLAEASGNRRIIELANSLPRDMGLTYLTNSSVEGFISGRSDLWRFPDNYDKADFLLVQPNAHQSFFVLSSDGYRDFSKAISRGKLVGSDDATIGTDMAQAMASYLVNVTKTHRIVVDEPGALLLERNEKSPLASHPSTLGFGWVPYLFARQAVKQPLKQ